MSHKSDFFMSKFLAAKQAFTYNDILLLPGWTEIEPSEADISTRLTPNWRLGVPLISSPMDTVTEDKMAIALTRLGGLGVLHRNCSIEEEVEMARRIKRAESFIIRDVVTVKPSHTIREALELMDKRAIHGLPVVSDKNRLVGIITWRDVRFAPHDATIQETMTKDVITATENVDLDEAKIIMHKHRIEKLPIVDKEGILKGLITIKDLDLRGQFPDAVRDEEGSLLVAAAISPHDLRRAKALEKYCNILVTDVAHFHGESVFSNTKKILKNVDAGLIVGNIGTYEAAIDCLTMLDGIVGLRCGIGSGSICSTSEVTKAGSPSVFASALAADAVREVGAKVSVIADGGIRNPGDGAVALAVGASALMLGNVFAGCAESPGRLVALQGRYYKQYWGMGSAAARKKRFTLDRYSTPSKSIEEGVEGWVPFRGPVQDVVKQFIGGLKAAMGYVGARDIPDMWKKAKLALVTAAGQREMRPHDILLPGAQPPPSS
ncbi:MAG: IMP dehydrogenase [Candidatus Ranarchaeia archaeon]